MAESTLNSEKAQRESFLINLLLRRTLSRSNRISSFFQEQLFGPGKIVLESMGEDGRGYKISNPRLSELAYLTGLECDERGDTYEEGLEEYAKDVMTGEEINPRYSETKFVIPVNPEDFRKLYSEIHSLENLRLESRVSDKVSLNNYENIDDFLYRMITFKMPDRNGVYEPNLSVERRELDSDNQTQVAYIFNRNDFYDNNTDPTLPKDSKKIGFTNSRHIVSGIKK